MNPASRTRATLAAVIVSLFASYSPLAAAPAAAAASENRGAEGSVVVLATHGARHGIGVGTVVAKAGTRVRILTAAHVATFGTLQLRLADGSAAAAALVQVFSGRDLALIEADVTASNAALLQAAPLGRPQTAEIVHLWGSGNDGPAYEIATVSSVGRDMPDGAPHGRYALGCALCHEGDSGAGIFNEQGELVGVYIGYFEVKTGRVSVAELPTADTVLAQRPLDVMPRLVASHASLVAAANVAGAR